MPQQGNDAIAKNTKSVEYANLLAVAIQAVHDLDAKMLDAGKVKLDMQIAQIAALTARIEALESGNVQSPTAGQEYSGIIVAFSEYDCANLPGNTNRTSLCQSLYPAYTNSKSVQDLQAIMRFYDGISFDYTAFATLESAVNDICVNQINTQGLTRQQISDLCNSLYPTYTSTKTNWFASPTDVQLYNSFASAVANIVALTDPNAPK